MACAGNSAETCGGNHRLDIYQASASTTAKSWKSLGCYTDSSSARTLVNYQSNAPKALTIETCQSICKTAGYAYAGVEFANECCTLSSPFFSLSTLPFSVLWLYQPVIVFSRANAAF
jgi:hypothetical protein